MDSNAVLNMNLGDEVTQCLLLGGSGKQGEGDPKEKCAVLGPRLPGFGPDTDFIADSALILYLLLLSFKFESNF